MSKVHHHLLLTPRSLESCLITKLGVGHCHNRPIMWRRLYKAIGVYTGFPNPEEFYCRVATNIRWYGTLRDRSGVVFPGTRDQGGSLVLIITYIYAAGRWVNSSDKITDFSMRDYLTKLNKITMLCAIWPKIKSKLSEIIQCLCVWKFYFEHCWNQVTKCLSVMP